MNSTTTKLLIASFLCIYSVICTATKVYHCKDIHEAITSFNKMYTKDWIASDGIDGFYSGTRKGYHEYHYRLEYDDKNNLRIFYFGYPMQTTRINDSTYLDTFNTKDSNAKILLIKYINGLKLVETEILSLSTKQASIKVTTYQCN